MKISSKFDRFSQFGRMPQAQGTQRYGNRNSETGTLTNKFYKTNNNNDRLRIFVFDTDEYILYYNIIK